MHRAFAVIVAISSLSPLWAVPQAPGEPKELKAQPAAAPVPSMKYRLLPASTELVPGNAATLYYRTFSFLTEAPPNFMNLMRGDWKKDDKGEEYSQVERWMKTPLKELPQKDIENFLGAFNAYFKELRQATHKQSCDWDIQGRPDGLLMLLPEVQSFRSIANIVCLKARFHIAQGNFDKAIEAMQINFRLAQHLAHGPTVIHNLVGITIARITLEEIEILIQQSNAPNLYWALSALPVPFSDLRLALELEPDSVFSMMPSLKELEKGPASAELMAALDADKKAFRAKLLVTKGFPEPMMIEGGFQDARAYLLAAGFKSEVLDKMPKKQVVLLDAMKRHRAAHQELSKWAQLPYQEAAKYMEKDETPFKESCARLDLFLFDTVLEKLGYYNGYARAFRAGAMLDRQIAALRIVEAIRLHAAEKGSLPIKQLSDVKAVPIPLDPMAGKAFACRFDSNKIEIHSPGPEGSLSQVLSLTYVLSLTKK